jgi:MATE family multidrug resistance protein
MSMSKLSRVVWKVSLPVILAGASENLLHLIDTIFLARVGVTEVGALAIADSVLLLFLVVPLGLAEAIQILASRRAGQRRPDAVGMAFNQGFLAVVLICLGATALLKVLWPFVGKWFVETGAMGSLVNCYLQIAAYGIFFVGASFGYSALLMSSGKTRALVPAAIILAGTNISFNYVLIYGKLGFPAMGMQGAALGSLAAEAAAFLFLAIYVLRVFDRKRYRLFHIQGLDRRTLRLLGRLSTPIVVQNSLETLRWLAFFLIFERVSEAALAIANIVYTCYVVFWIPTEGFAETSCSMVSRFVGRNQPERIGALLRDAIGGALMATFPFLALALLMPRWFFALFAPEWVLLADGSASLRVVALAMLIVIPAEIWFVAVTGTGDTAAALGIELILTGTMLGIAYLTAIPLAWPVELVWISLPIAWSVCLLISYLWMKSRMWQRLQI